MVKALLCLIALSGVEANLWDKLKAVGDKTKHKAEKAGNGVVPVFWGKLSDTAKENIEKYSDVVPSTDLLENSKITVSSCGGEDHAMQVRDVHFDTKALELHVKGNLGREVAGGKVTMDLKLGKASAKMTKTDIMKRRIAWIASGKHYDEEALCNHFNRYETACPVKNGERELRFGFKRLPQALSAGGYEMIVKAVDENGGPVLCVAASIDVPFGPQGELFRRLQEVVSSGNALKLGLFSLALLVTSAAW
jgi:hypothetical protein